MAELAALYALEALGDDAQRGVHVRWRPPPLPTREDVAAFQGVVQDLAFSGLAIVTGFSQRLMARIAQEPQEAAEANRPHLRPQQRGGLAGIGTIR